jgi:glutathione synthase/RimK-type ligase-like ATP-grasp enzyme
LHEALLAECEHRWLESFNLCSTVLALEPEQPDALNLLGRLCGVAGDAPRAIGLQRRVLRLAPDHACAARDLVDALCAVRSSDEARQAYDAAVAIEPDIVAHHRLPGAQQRFVGIDSAEAYLRRAIELDASFAPAQAALGNVFARQTLFASAIQAYGLAVLLDWDFADAHLGLGNLWELVRDEAAAARHYREALSRKRVYVSPERSAVRRVLVLKGPGMGMNNAPLDFAVNPARTALHLCYVTGGDDTAAPLPEHEVIFCGIDEAESSDSCMETAERLIASDGKPVINRPSHLPKLRRSQLRSTLQDVAGCTVPLTIRVNAKGARDLFASPQTAGLRYPLLIRPVDTHRGDGLQRISSPQFVPTDLNVNECFNVSQFIDYRSNDGFYRKYRVIVIAGRPFAYHLAISEHWMVHYISSPMADNAWMRDEEERFLRDPESVFPDWERTFGAIADAVGLEYFGIDCARNPDGGVLVFEAGPDMLVHCTDPADVFAYKYRYVPRIFDALEELLDARSAACFYPNRAASIEMDPPSTPSTGNWTDSPSFRAPNT